MAKKAKYFVDREFRRCNPPCSIEDMQQAFLNKLDEVREKAGIPLVLNSAYRSPEWDKKQGRTGTGAHTIGQAVDIRCNSDANRYKIIKAALECGIRRIGVYPSWVHIDTAGNGYAQDIIWYS